MQSNSVATRTPPIKLLLTVNEAAQMLSLGRSAMYALLLSGAIPSIKIGRVRRVPLYGLDAFIHRQVSEDSAVSEQA